jgi:aminoglycoside phosphotransferase (APT) family kinase protein
LSIPVPLAAGIPEGEFPYPWSVYRWLAGEDLAARTDVDLSDVASRLGEFLAALQRIDTASVPVSPRATPVDARDDDIVRGTIRQLSEEGDLDGDAAVAVWESALAAPSWNRPLVWIHGDLFPSNLLAERRSIGSSHRLRPPRPGRSSDRHASGLDLVDRSEP